jgi:hypothetical protein
MAADNKQKVKKPLTKGYAKVPIIMQMEGLECGAASLTMVLAYYGKWLPLEQVRADCGYPETVPVLRISYGGP